MPQHFFQQSIEKALKGLYMLKTKESAGTTHSLIYLANKVNVPEKYFEFLRELTPVFITTRYPDITKEVPYKLFSEEKVKKIKKNLRNY